MLGMKEKHYYWHQEYPREDVNTNHSLKLLSPYFVDVVLCCQEIKALEQVVQQFHDVHRMTQRRHVGKGHDVAEQDGHIFMFLC